MAKGLSKKEREHRADAAARVLLRGMKKEVAKAAKVAKEATQAATKAAKAAKVTKPRKTGGEKKSTASKADAELLARIRKNGAVLPRSIGEKYDFARGSVTTRSRDAQRRALAPGWRISAKGNEYFENRRNRSDRNRRSKPWL